MKLYKMMNVSGRKRRNLIEFGIMSIIVIANFEVIVILLGLPHTG